MALFPCAVGSHRYAGPQRSAYLGIASGGLSARSRLRLCKPHFDDVRAFCDAALGLIAIGEITQKDMSEDEQCPSCPEGIAGEYRAFATLYPLKEEAYVYFANLCQDHADGFRRVGQIELA